MSYRYIDVTRDGHVVTCTLSNPPNHTLTARGVREIFGVLDDVEADTSVRALVFTGAGEGVFIAHYEVGELSESAQRNIEASATAAPRKRASRSSRKCTSCAFASSRCPRSPSPP